MDKVEAVVQEWMLYANVDLQRVASKGKIRITFQGRYASSSFVGREILWCDPEDATMNFARIDPYTTTPDSDERAVILHEFGHALGMLHEHQSPARGGVLTLNVPSEFSLRAVYLIL